MTTTTKTKSQTPASDLQKLADLKMEIINLLHHEKVKEFTAQGDCYQTLSAIKSCERFMDKLKDDITDHFDNGGTDADPNLLRKVELFEDCEDQLVEHQLKHDAAKLVYRDITGSDFQPVQKRKAIPSDRLKRIMKS